MTAPLAPAAPAIEPAPSGDADNLTALARHVERLTPSHRDREAFHVEKSEIAGALRRMARAMRQPRREELA